MVGNGESMSCCYGFGECVNPVFELGRGIDIEHRSAGVTDHMVMVPGEVFGEFVASGVIGCDEPVHDTCLFEDGEVPVCGTLRHALTAFEEVRHRQRPV